MTVSDLYSSELLTRKMEPSFYNYYNIEYKDGFTMPAHAHECIEIMYVKKGSCEVYVNESKNRLEPGDIILINGNVPHKLNVSKNTPCRVLCLEFIFETNPEAILTLAVLSKDIRETRLFLKSEKQVLKFKDTVEVYSTLYDLYKELEAGDPGSRVMIQSLFFQFIIKFSRLYCEHQDTGNNPAARYIKDAVIFMCDNYHEEIGVGDVARHVKLNVSYFYKIFKQVTKTTPSDYLNEIRINKAKMLLEKSDIPVIDICNYVGFNSRQYFSYIFKKATGFAPAEYRRKAARKAESVNANRLCSEYMHKS